MADTLIVQSHPGNQVPREWERKEVHIIIVRVLHSRVDHAIQSFKKWEGDVLTHLLIFIRLADVDDV